MTGTERRDRLESMVAPGRTDPGRFRCNGDISTVMSPRTVITWAENTRASSAILAFAFRVTFLNKCDEAGAAAPSPNTTSAASTHELPTWDAGTAAAGGYDQQPEGRPLEGRSSARPPAALRADGGTWQISRCSFPARAPQASTAFGHACPCPPRDLDRVGDWLWCGGRRMPTAWPCACAIMTRKASMPRRMPGRRSCDAQGHLRGTGTSPGGEQSGAQPRWKANRRQPAGAAIGDEDSDAEGYETG